LGTAIVNPLTGRLYIAPSGISRRIDAKTFAVTDNAFGVVQAVDPATGRLYAVSGKVLQIVDGKPDPEVLVLAVTLGYSPSGMGVNNQLGHLYLSNAAQSSVEVRNLKTGALLATFPLAPGASPGGIAVDPTRARLYISATASGQNLLFVVKDVSAPTGTRPPYTR
jgi:DNA-binding beta-propeller fold protein YncE